MAPQRTISSNEVELLYTKSKTYLHPTTSKRDNIAGFLSLSRGPNATNNDILLSFTPETQLSAQELKVYQQVDVDELTMSLAALLLQGLRPALQLHQKRNQPIAFAVVSKPSTSILSSYSFSVAVSFIYSIQVRKPSVGWWFGSIVINTRDGEKFPIVFFHDDESPSTLKQQRVRNASFDPFGEGGDLFWGGQEFINVLSKFANVEKSAVEPSCYLINPDSVDLRNFAPYKTPNKEAAVPKAPPYQLPDVNKFLVNAKWKVLETVASFLARTRNQVADLVEEHAPQPIKQIIKKPEVQRISDEFDSARVYLAKWAAQVKEEAEESQRKFMLDDEIYNKINREIGSNELLTEEEINATSRRKVISLVEWLSFFDHSGRLCVTAQEVKLRVFHGGLDDAVRGEAWLFLLGVYPWDLSREERLVLKESFDSAYREFKLKWVDNEDKRSEDFWKDQKHRIEKDINRTDRQLPIFLKKRQVLIQGIDSVQGPQVTSRESSPETPDEDEDEFDVANIKNPHLFRMREVLLTYNEYNVNLGYVQGMTDLLSPLYVKFQDEPLTFWAFAKFMERMEKNFVRDQLGMKNQMLVLNELVQFMLPDLYKHLHKCESTDLFFFFRMLLVWFKREFEWDDVCRLWEVLWTDNYSSQFHLFVALSVLSDNERIIIQNLQRFDEVLKYMNDLSMNMNLDHLLIRAELLFLRFRRMIDIIDRENTKGDHNASTNIRVSPVLRNLLSRKIVVQKEVERPEGVGGG